MPDLVDAGPCPLLIATISVAMISLIASNIKTLRQWRRPALAGILLLQRFSWIQKITYLRLGYFVMLIYSITHILGVAYLLSGGNPCWLDETIIWLFILNATFILFWVWVHALYTRERPVTPKPIYTDSN